MSKQISQFMMPEGWRPKRREHGGLRQVRRTKDKQLHFKGQENDEDVKMVVRQHPIFLFKPAGPVVGVLVLFLLVLALSARFSEFGPLWLLLNIMLLALLLITLGYFLWKDFFVWWVNIDIITNKRVIACRGFLQPTRKIITLDKIMQISTDQDSPASVFLAYGDVHIYLSGGQHVMKNVPKPREVRDAVDGIFQEFRAKKPAPQLPPLGDSELHTVIGTLGKLEERNPLPNADERYAHRHRPDRLRRPLRRFGGPLQIPAEVTYASDEYTVMYIQRSKWLLIFRLLAPGALFIAGLVLTFILSALAPLTLVSMLALLIASGLIVINYVDDVFILTNRRIIDIERRFIFFYEVHVEAEYKNIRDIKIRINNIVENLFDMGNVYVETPGQNPDINMTMIDHPFFIADKINHIKDFKEKDDKAKAKNERQEELVKWFTSVAAVLERKMVSRGVPNLQTMDLWSASAMASEMGMRVVPVGEDDSYPEIEAGRIVSQNPLPGTLMSLENSSSSERPQIHVVLSRRN